MRHWYRGQAREGRTWILETEEKTLQNDKTPRKTVFHGSLEDNCVLLRLWFEGKWLPEIQVMQYVGFYFLLSANYCKREYPGWMDKQKVVYTYYGVLSILKKERTFDMCHNMNLKDIMPHDKSQMQKDKYRRSPCVCGTRSH